MSQSPFFPETRPKYADAALLSLARDLRDRAEEVLTRAESFLDADAREMMLKIAERYEKLARRLEHEADGADKA